MTYRELLDHLCRLTDEQLNMDLTIRESNDEYYPARLSFNDAKESDVLDHGHPFFEPYIMEEPFPLVTRKITDEDIIDAGWGSAPPMYDEDLLLAIQDSPWETLQKKGAL
jgi:hypothetical protein